MKDLALRLEREATRHHIQTRHDRDQAATPMPLVSATRLISAPSTLLCAFIFGLQLLLLLLWLFQWFRKLQLLMGSGITQFQRQRHLRVAIGLIGKAQKTFGQILKFLAEKLVLLRPGEHISCLKAICVCRPRHQRSPSASAKSLEAKS